MGKGSNPRTLPGGSEFLARFQGAESSWAPLGAKAPPLPVHLWERQARREAPRATAAGGITSSAPASACSGASTKVLERGGALRARPPCGQLGKISGRAPWTRATVAVPGWPRRPGRACGGPEAQGNGSSFPSSPRPLSPPAPAACGHLALATPRGESFIPSISQRRKLQSVMAHSANPKSRSWLEPSPDCESEAHGLCRPDLGGSQA